MAGAKAVNRDHNSFPGVRNWDCNYTEPTTDTKDKSKQGKRVYFQEKEGPIKRGPNASLKQEARHEACRDD